jgi:hypothetical protein
MFVTYILACSLYFPEHCVELRDTRGPYATETECAARAVELSKELDKLFTVPQTYKFQCIEGNVT